MIKTNNRGFIATAVLYSVTIILAILLFIILRNVATTRKLALENANDVKNELLTYEVVYDPNSDITTRMENSTMYTGQSEVLSTSIYQRYAYDFLGWSSTPDGETEYLDEATVKDLTEPNKIFTLYATWKRQTYDVVYNANGGTGTMATSTFNIGEQSTLSTNAFKRTNYDFTGWALTASGAVKYTNKGKIIDPVAPYGTLQLYAKWAYSYAPVGDTISASGHMFYEATSGSAQFSIITNQVGNTFTSSGGKIIANKPVKQATITYYARGNMYGPCESIGSTGVTVYLRKNGSDISTSTGDWDKSGNSNVGTTINISMAKGDYLTMYGTANVNSNCTPNSGCGDSGGGGFITVTVTG